MPAPAESFRTPRARRAEPIHIVPRPPDLRSRHASRTEPSPPTSLTVHAALLDQMIPWDRTDRPRWALGATRSTPRSRGPWHTGIVAGQANASRGSSPPSDTVLGAPDLRKRGRGPSLWAPWDQRPAVAEGPVTVGDDGAGDGGVSVQVKWRLGGRWQGETFTDLRLAAEFRTAVEAAGHRWRTCPCVRAPGRSDRPGRLRAGRVPGHMAPAHTRSRPIAISRTLTACLVLTTAAPAQSRLDAAPRVLALSRRYPPSRLRHVHFSVLPGRRQIMSGYRPGSRQGTSVPECRWPRGAAWREKNRDPSHRAPGSYGGCRESVSPWNQQLAESSQSSFGTKV
jgi:hypothetical protein